MSTDRYDRPREIISDQIRLRLAFQSFQVQRTTVLPAHLCRHPVPPHGELFGRRVRKTARIARSEERTGHPQRCEPPNDRPCSGTFRGDNAEALTHLRKSLFLLYNPEHTDANIYIASVAVYAKVTELYNLVIPRINVPTRGR